MNGHFPLSSMHRITYFKLLTVKYEVCLWSMKSGLLVVKSPPVFRSYVMFPFLLLIIVYCCSNVFVGSVLGPYFY